MHYKMKETNILLAREDFIKENMFEYSSGQTSRLEFIKKSFQEHFLNKFILTVNMTVLS